MNEDKIRFVFIAGTSHGAVDISRETYNKIIDILYGKADES
mgnify:CR=1 FL=1